MSIEELKAKKVELEKDISKLLVKFDNETEQEVNTISFIRQSNCTGLGTELSCSYAVKVDVFV